jgi:hypothetical protein
MGSLFSSKTKTESSGTSDTGPSKFQQPYLDTLFNGAQADYTANANTPAYQGETYAGLSPEQKATYGNLTTYANGTGMSAGGQLSNIGSSQLDANAGKAGSSLDQYQAMALQDPTSANLAKAAQYANNPELQGQIDAASRDVTRNLSETQIPGIDRSASASGNINSSRAGVASGIAQRGAQDQIGDIGSSMRGAAWNTGLAAAQADRTQTLGALNNASQGYSALTSQGAALSGQGAAQSYQALNAANTAGTAEQADRQGQDTAAQAQWTANDTRKSDLLARYQAIVGNQAWGSSGNTTGTGTTTQSGNIGGQLLGAAATVGAAFAKPG